MYDKLTPWERLPLLMAARRRGDEGESGRLAATAPKVACQLPDYYGLGQAFTLVSLLHFIEVSRLAAQYFATFRLPDDTRKEEQVALDQRVLMAHLFKTTLAGWRQFCAEFRFDPESCWSSLPGFDVVNRAADGSTAQTPLPKESGPRSKGSSNLPTPSPKASGPTCKSGLQTDR
jgi:hypothetical protein